VSSRHWAAGNKRHWVEPARIRTATSSTSMLPTINTRVNAIVGGRKRLVEKAIAPAATSKLTKLMRGMRVSTWPNS
jgi:hypothetical protein